MKIIEEGHFFEMFILDEQLPSDKIFPRYISFVKRVGEKYPGNNQQRPGTISQDVVRVLLNRARYVQKQKWFVENTIFITLLKIALWFLEFRAARAKGVWYFHTPNFAEFAKLCPIHGHTFCLHEGEGK